MSQFRDESLVTCTDDSIFPILKLLEVFESKFKERIELEGEQYIYIYIYIISNSSLILTKMSKYKSPTTGK